MARVKNWCGEDNIWCKEGGQDLLERTAEGAGEVGAAEVVEVVRSRDSDGDVNFSTDCRRGRDGLGLKFRNHDSH